MNQKGFTLLELMIVVLIIGILSSVALPKYQKAVAKAKTVEATTTAKTLMDAIAIYATAYRECPDRLDVLDIKIAGIEPNAPQKASGKYWNYSLGNIDGKVCYVDLQSVNQNVNMAVRRAYIYKTGAAGVPTGLARGQLFWTGDGSKDSEEFFKTIQAEKKTSGSDAYYQ